jgi:hypothetical protein
MTHQFIREAIALNELRHAGRITTGQMLERVHIATGGEGHTVNMRKRQTGGRAQAVELTFSTGDVLLCDGVTCTHTPPATRPGASQ